MKRSASRNENWGKWLSLHRSHLIAWAVLIVWEVVTIGLFSGSFGHPATYAIHYALVIGLFYCHALLALPWSVRGGGSPIWRVPLVALLEGMAFLISSYVLDHWLIWAGFIQEVTAFAFTMSYVLRTLYRGLYFMGFATGYYYLQTYLDEKKKSDQLQEQHYLEIIRRQQAEEESIKAQNAFLTAQINPHFFFNTLDYLYHNVLDVSPAAAEAISSLATMMRFAIDADKMGDQVCLRDELEQIEHLIYLHQIRQPLFIDVDIDEEILDLKLIPLILLTLVENVFKHGYLKSPESPARISIWKDRTMFYVETRNKVGNQRYVQASHTGMLNTAKRLQNAYGDEVVFQYGAEEDSSYRVKLIIPLAKLSYADASVYL